MKRRTVSWSVCLVLGLGVGVGPVLASGPATAPLRSAVGGLGHLALRGSSDLGPAPAAAHQHLTLALALRDRAGLDRLLQAQITPGSADYHRWLTPEQFAARFSPSPHSVDQVRAFAKAHGLAVPEVSPNRSLVELDGTTAQVNSAFGVVEHRVRAAGQTFLTPDRAAALPKGLAGLTAAVLGLTTYRADHLASHTRSAGANPYQPYPGSSYSPRAFWEIYDAPAKVTGTGQRVAVITSGNLTRVASDLAVFQDRFSLPHVPLQVVQSGGSSTDTSGALEYDLDTQYSTGFAPGVKAVVAYNHPQLAAVQPLNRFVTDNRVKTASASYGGCEVIDDLIGEVDADEQVFRQARAQGQTLFVSTGDEGSSCAVLVNTGTPVGVPDVEYPASSANVVAVGGTTLTGETAQPTREISWLGGGGGYSQFATAPSWQKSSTTFQPALGRGLPDVSLDADDNSGYDVVVAGRMETVGGTSASAPSWNGIWARVLQKHPKAGFAAPALYAARSSMVDITLGTNGLWAATSGYDLSTGLGTADIAKLVANVR